MRSNISLKLLTPSKSPVPAKFQLVPTVPTRADEVVIKEIGGHRIGIIGQAMPYVPIAHPKRFTPNWTFGIRDAELQKVVDRLREQDKVDAVILLSHNGMDVDLKLASRVTGIDVVLGGHPHDAVPQPITVTNAGGKTVVTNAGSSGKFLAVLDLDVGKGRVNDIRYHLLPVYANLIKPDPAMQMLIDRLRAPHKSSFDEKLATADVVLYRRGNFTGTMDQVICDALRQQLDAQIALSPGFRWGDDPQRPTDHDGRSAFGDRNYLSGGLCCRDDRGTDQGNHGGCRR